MSTQKLYLLLPETTTNATVRWISQDRTTVRLDRTLFHPQGGGQPYDLGTINECAVRSVLHGERGEVDHTMSKPSSLNVGDPVTISVDASRRELNSTWHTAGHVVAEAAKALKPNWVAVQGHHWPTEGRVEFRGVDSVDESMTAELDHEISRLVAADLPIGIVGDPFLDRKIRIGNLSAIPCGGTHVASTAKLGSVCITKLRLKGGVLRASYAVH